MGLSPIWLLLDVLDWPKALGKTPLHAFRFFFYVGLATFGISLFLGDEAYDAVKNTACSLGLLQKHDDLAHMSLYFYLVGLLYEPAQVKFSKKIVGPVIFIFLLIGTYYLIETGHTGAESVYDLGTGVQTTVCP